MFSFNIIKFFCNIVKFIKLLADKNLVTILIATVTIWRQGNAQDGIFMVQSAEGALNEIHEMLQRVNKLAVRAANGTLTEEDRAMVDAEVQQIESEINTTAEHTVFNEMRLFPDDGIWPSTAFPSAVSEYNIHYNLKDGSFTVDMPDGSGVSASAAAMGRAGVGPVSQGGALADLIATELIPDAANQIFSAFPSLKTRWGVKR